MLAPRAAPTEDHGMRAPFAHEAVLRLGAGGDPRAPGAGVTVALCGHWEHEGACRWPHVSSVSDRVGEELVLRILFAAEPGDEREVRSRIVEALRRGRVEEAPQPSAWTLIREGPAALRADEVSHAEELTRL